MSEHLYHIVRFLNPAARVRGTKREPFDYMLQDDGDGPYIKMWDEQVLGPQPSTKELDQTEASPEFQNYLAGLEKNVSIDEAKAGISEKELALARLVYAVAGKTAPDNTTLLATLQADLDNQKIP